MSIGKNPAIILLAIALGILVVLIATPWDFSYLKNRKEVSVEEAAQQIKDAQEIYIIEILTDNSSLNQKIMQCGVDIAFSMGMYNKSVHPYVINNTQCFNEWGEYPKWLCAKSLYFKNGFNFYIEKGVKVSTYDHLITIDPLKAENCQVILQG